MIHEMMDEDSIRDMVTDVVDYAIVDEGIGYYEMGDGKYEDVDMQMRIVETTIKVWVPCEPDSVIFTEVRGMIEEDGYSCDWVAELLSVEWDASTKKFKTEYEIRED